MTLVPANPAALTFGQTALTGDNLPMPRVKVIQAQSAEITSVKANPGDFFNTLTGQNYGPTLRFIPILPFMNRILLVREEKRDRIDAALAGAGLPVLSPETTLIACKSLDMQTGRGEPGIDCNVCPLSKWEGKTPPLCAESYNVAAMDEMGDLIILSFSKSGAAAGRKLFAALRFSRTAPWGSIYEVTSHQEALKGKGTFNVPSWTRTSDRPAPELLRWAGEWAEQLGAAGPIDVTPLDEEAPEEVGEQPF